MSLKVWLKDINDINNGITDSDYISNGVMTNINEAKEVFNNEKGFSICLSIFNNSTSSASTCNNIITGSTSIFSISNAPNYGSISVNIGAASVCTIDQCIPINERHNLIVLFDVVDSKVRVYIDGILKSESDLTSIPTITSTVTILNDIDYLDIEDYRIYDEPISKKLINEISRMKLLHCPFNDSGYQGTVNYTGNVVSNYKEIDGNIATIEKTTLFGRPCLKITKPKDLSGEAGIYVELNKYGFDRNFTYVTSIEYYIHDTLTQPFIMHMNYYNTDGVLVPILLDIANVTQKVSGVTRVYDSYGIMGEKNIQTLRLQLSFYNRPSTSDDTIYIFTTQVEDLLGDAPSFYTEDIREGCFSDVTVYGNNGIPTVEGKTPYYYLDPHFPIIEFPGYCLYCDTKTIKFDVTSKFDSGTIIINQTYCPEPEENYGDYLTLGDIIAINTDSYITIGDYACERYHLDLINTIAICWTKGVDSKIYINGELYDTCPAIDTSTLSPSSLIVGSDDWVDSQIIIYGLRLYGRELTADEIRDLTITTASISNKNELFIRNLIENTSQVSLIDDYENIAISDGVYSDKAHFTVNETPIGTIGSITTTSDGIVRLIIPEGDITSGEKYVVYITTREPDCITDMNTLCGATFTDKSSMSTVAIGVATATNMTSLYVDCTVAPNKTIIFDTLHLYKYNDLSSMSLKLNDFSTNSIIIEDKYLSNTKLNKNNALISKEIIEY